MTKRFWWFGKEICCFWFTWKFFALRGHFIAESVETWMEAWMYGSTFVVQRWSLQLFMNLDGELSKVLILAQQYCVCACRDPSITLTQPAHLKLLTLMINQSILPIIVALYALSNLPLWLRPLIYSLFFFLFKTRFVLPLPPGTHFIALQCKWTPLGAISETPTETHDCKKVMLLRRPSVRSAAWSTTVSRLKDCVTIE